MKLKYQRLTYTLFFLIFFIGAPALILYTAGYSYNFKANKLEKTGIISLDSRPQKASVSLDGKYYGQTPLRITRLLPDEYSVVISKPGYYAWSKAMSVKSNLTTFFRDIILFKKNLPTIQVEGNIIAISASPNQERMVLIINDGKKDQLKMLSLKTGMFFDLDRFNNDTYNSIEFLSWSPEKNKILVRQKIGDFNKYLIVDTNTLKTKELLSVTKLNFEKIVWGGKTDNHLYGLRKNVIYYLELNSQSNKSLASGQISDFKVQDDWLYYISKIDNNYYLTRKNLSDQALEEKIKLPGASDYTLENSPANYLTLLDQKNNDLFIITDQIFSSENTENEIILQAKAKDVFWSDDLKKIIYYNNSEIWTYNVETKKNQLINRYSSLINQVLWYPGNNYIIYQIDDKIRVSETTEDGIKNDITLAKLSEIRQIAIDNTGKNIYFLGKAGLKQGIFQLVTQ